MENVRYVMSPRLTKFLLRQGFHIIDITKNQKNHERTVFIFEKSEELEIAINKYKTRYQPKEK